MAVKDYQSESFVRVRINKSELLMLMQLLEKCKPSTDLTDFHGERHAVHTFANKLTKAFKEVENE